MYTISSPSPTAVSARLMAVPITAWQSQNVRQCCEKVLLYWLGKPGHICPPGPHFAGHRDRVLEGHKTGRVAGKMGQVGGNTKHDIKSKGMAMVFALLP